MPAPPSLSEAEEAFAEGFLDDILLCLPILGYALFESAETARQAPHRRIQVASRSTSAPRASKPQAPTRQLDSWYGRERPPQPPLHGLIASGR